MKMHFERSDGFAGVLSSTIVDTEKHACLEASEIKKLVDKAYFFELQSCSRLNNKRCS
jgi:hypothetical protein